MYESSPPGRNDPRLAPADEPADRLWDDALRRARRDAADRATQADGEARGPARDNESRRIDERARLEHLLAALTPILRRIPAEAEMFDVGVTQGFGRDADAARPRLFLDMIGSVECAPQGGFRLAQATRRGRLVLGEARDLAGAMRLVADYIARRLVEREAALAGDRTVEDAARRLILRERQDAARARDDAPTRWTRPAPEPRRDPPALPRVDDPAPPRVADPAPPRARRPDPQPPAALDPEEDSPAPARPGPRDRLAATRARWRRWREARAGRRGGALERGLVFAVQFLGSAALTLIVALAAWWAWKAAGFVK